MKNIAIAFLLLLGGTVLTYGQTGDPLVSQCVMNAGSDAKYLKDFRVQLGKAENSTDTRFKAKMSLWKNTRYRFSMCNADNSQGKLILIIRDEANKQVLSSFDKNTGKIFPYIDFTCNKSGVYQICFDFENGQQGSGVGVVSMIR
ncbi:MAG TPA: hypothetical protein VHO46_10245 [Bacteroidales bacterium]|nr:hypothetical protein [Bacteroidales bacterium]